MVKHDYREYIKIIQIIHSLTKMDIRLMDHSSTIIDQISNHTIPAVLHQPNDEHRYINDVLRANEHGHYYHFVNSSGLEYVAAGIWKHQSLDCSIIVGPFISSIAVLDFVKDVIVNNQLPVGERNQLEHFYKSLPVVGESELQHIGELIGHLCMHNHIRSKQITANTRRPTRNTSVHKVMLEEQKETIERRYEFQNNVMDAISRGDKEEITKVLVQLSAELVAFTDRVPESPIRSSKNIGFVLNTMCRIAAERSGVHPVYLHNISERFAILIEKTFTIPQLNALFLTMGQDYCELVTTVATGQYSLIVKRAIDYILLNLSHPLFLEQIAEQIHITPTYLSRRFKQETGETIIDFINRKRVEEAAVYLRRGNISVTEAAFLVGYNDLNYFSKVFKKIMSVTPSRYAKGLS